MKILMTLAGILFSISAFAGSGDNQSAPSAKTSFKSVYTDLDKDCTVISAATDKAPIDFYQAECKSFGGYRLQVKGGDLRYHPELSFGDKVLAIKTPSVFHDVASSKIEWVFKHTIDEDGLGEIEWKGLIYRLEIDDLGDVDRSTLLLYAIRLDGEKTCLIGTTQSNAKARELVYNSKSGCN